MKLFVLDPHSIYRRGLAACLSGLPEVESVAHPSTVREAWEHAALFDSDLVLLDQVMPGGTGLDVLPELRALTPEARIVMFSAADDIRRDALRLGADDCVGKELPFHEVAEALRAG